MDLFKNPNIASALIERLPCAFAPSVNGQMGTHYAMVLLDDKGNVIYVGSECEAKHGDGIQAMHEMGDRDGTLCYVVTAAFRAALATFHASKTKSLHVDHDRPKDAAILTRLMNRVFTDIWHRGVDLHNSRHVNKMLRETLRDVERRNCLQNVINNVTGSMLHLPITMEHGNYTERVDAKNFVVSELQQPSVFTVHLENSVFPGFPMFARYRLSLRNQQRDQSFAVREKGVWKLEEEPLKSWASDNHTVFENTGNPRKLGWYSEKRCLFCGDEYQRMSKHTQGAKHIDRVLEVAKLTCKATSRMGLQMLNNPRTRSVFIKR